LNFFKILPLNSREFKISQKTPKLLVPRSLVGQRKKERKKERNFLY
jgi:hypothetical protein